MASKTDTTTQRFTVRNPHELQILRKAVGIFIREKKLPMRTAMAAINLYHKLKTK